MEELWLDGHRIDLPSKTVSQTLQINDLAELKDRQANYTNRFKVPMTPKNVMTFEYLGITGNQSRKPYERISAKLVVDGIELISNGYAQIKETNKNYEVVIYDGNISLYEELKGKRINDLNYQDLNHYLNIQSYEESFGHTEGYIYGIGDFGHSYLSSYVSVERQAPSLFVHTIWNKIFTEAGFTYSGDFFENDQEFLKEVITPTKGYDVENTTTSVSNLGSVATNTISHYEVAPGSALTFEDKFTLSPTSGLNNIQVLNSPTDGSYIKVNYTGNLRINLNINYSLSDGFASVRVKLNNSTISYSNLSQGGNQNISKQLNINVESGDKIKVEMFSGTAFIDPEFEPTHVLNVTASCAMSLSSISGGQYIDFATITPETSQINFIKDVMQRHGLLFKPRKNSKHYDFVTIESLLNDRANAEDWSNKLSTLSKESYSIGNYAKENYVKYNYEESVIEPTHDGVLSVDNENIQDEKTLFTSIYKISIQTRTHNGQPIYNIPLWENVEEDGTYVVKNRETDLRIFKIKKINDSINARFFTVSNSTNIEGELPYLSLEKIEYEFYLNNYYPAFNRILNSPKKRTDIFYLTPIDVYNIDFFKLKYLKQLGQYYYLNKISNFRNGRLTKCELIQVSGVTFNQPPNQLGIKEITISHGSSVTLNLSHFTDTTPPYADPEFDDPERIKIVSGFGANDVVMKNNGTVINSELIVDANNFNLVIEDLGNLIPEHNEEFEFTIQSFNSPYYSTSIGKIKIRVLERVNYAPNADAGSNRTLTYDSSGTGTGYITISGSGSSDPNGDSLTYQWSLVSAPSVVTIGVNPSTPHQARVSVNDPNGFSNNISFNVKLRVTDPFGLFDEDTVQVTLNDLNSDGQFE